MIFYNSPSNQPRKSSLEAILTIAFSFGLLWVDREESNLGEGLRSLTLPLRGEIGESGAALRDFFSAYRPRQELFEENKALRSRLSAQGDLREQIQRLRAENDRLRSLLGLREQRPTAALHPATVIHSGRSHPFRTLTVALTSTAPRLDESKLSALFQEGESTKIVEATRTPQLHLKAGQLAIAEGALVGTVKRIRWPYAEIIPLGSEQSSIDVVLEESRLYGIATGLGDQGRFLVKIEHLQRRRLAIEGERVLTAGRGGRYPEGLVLGWIVNLRLGRGELFQEAHLVPRISPDRLKELFILLESPGPAPALEGSTSP
ncbi:MAG: rod shape-determining protein MreC [Myxococcota bacterium]|nr:rod shape-determining protein MreC [Myxococcota bacterium]